MTKSKVVNGGHGSVRSTTTARLSCSHGLGGIGNKINSNSNRFAAASSSHGDCNGGANSLNRHNHLNLNSNPINSSSSSPHLHHNRPLFSSFKYFFFSYFSYSTVRLARVHSLRVAIIFRLFQIIIFSYIIGWDIFYKKGYQISDEEATSTITTKVKGLGYVKYDRMDAIKSKMFSFTNSDEILTSSNNNSSGEYNNEEKIQQQVFSRIFDTADYIIPSSEYNSIFVLTNFAQVNQKQGRCPEEYNKNDFTDVTCDEDMDCKNKVVTNVWNGFPTGRCVRSITDKSIKVCEIETWCPIMIEDKTSKSNLIQNVENYTILIKNNIQFKLFNKKESNYLSSTTNKYITECAYTKPRDPHCPVFLISDILASAEPDPVQREFMMMRGGIIEILITWNCDYDIFWRPCKFTYEFFRFDLKFTRKSSIASGFNFRTSYNYMIDDVLHRTLIKAYGLKFIIVVTGRAGKFNIVPLLITIGSGIGLLSIATIIADLAISTFSKEKQIYNDLIVLDTQASEDKNALPPDSTKIAAAPETEIVSMTDETKVKESNA